MFRRLGAQAGRQVHRRDPSKNPKAFEPCGQLSRLTRNTVAALPFRSKLCDFQVMLEESCHCITAGYAVQYRSH
jgi:hypothetical protein